MYSVDNEAIVFPYEFPVGSTVVNVLVTDIHGNLSTRSFTVEVEDTEAFVVECPIPDNPYYNDDGQCYASIEFEADASDNCGVDSIVYSVDNEAITFPNNFPVGSTVVDVLVTDIHGNTATCSFTVVVEDTESPVLECQETDNQDANEEGACVAYLDFEVEVSDNCEVESTVYSVDDVAIEFPYNFSVGSTVVYVLATDIHGNYVT